MRQKFIQAVVVLQLLWLGFFRVAAEEVRTVRWADLSDMRSRAIIRHAVHTDFSRVTCGGIEKSAIFHHAAAPGKPLAAVIFPDLDLPRLEEGGESIVLRVSLGFRDGDAFKTAPGVDGCRFVMQVNGKEIFSQAHAEQTWVEHHIDLKPWAGQQVNLTLLMDPGQTSAADWAAWGEPKILVQGSGPGMDLVAEACGQTVPEFWSVPELVKRPVPSRIAFKSETAHAGVLVSVLDERLDLATRLLRIDPNPSALVPLAPPLVVGEGEHPENHTLVKILNPYGIADLQFLAYPLTVRGGVAVESLKTRQGELRILTAPLLSQEVKTLHVFTRDGAWVRALPVPDVLTPPYRILVDDFVPQRPGEEIVITSRYPSPGSNQVLVLDAAGGRILYRCFIPMLRAGEVNLMVFPMNGKPTVLVQQANSRAATLIGEPEWRASRSRQRISLPIPAGWTAYPSAFGDETYLATGPDPARSYLFELTREGARRIDVGRYENRFWVALQKDYLEKLGPLEGIETSQHIRLVDYGHIRTETPLRPLLTDPELARKQAQTVHAFFKARGYFNPLDQQPLRMWEPCFTHRQPIQPFRPWAEQKDPVTGLPKYLMIGRNGHADGYGQWDAKGFLSSTYASGLPLLDALYDVPLRGFLQFLAPAFRAKPEWFPSLEPNHEHEIVVSSDGGLGDYNPRMIEGFYDFLVRQYGRDAAHIAQVTGTDLTDWFDAPRSRERAVWDAYVDTNPFYRAWIAHNRNVINQTLAGTFTDALRAGFPPQLIASHQIPDRFGLPGLTTPAGRRISPIDYAMTAGVGFGYTRFGLFYKNPKNVQAAAQASGFDDVVLGEYNSLSADPDEAYAQLRYLYDHGVKAMHVLYWNNTHSPNFKEDEQAYNAALFEGLKRLVAEDRPRPGLTGGVGQVRPYVNGDRRFNIVAIGTGSERTGLLKSLREDGSMEGSVYVVPWQKHVNVTSVPVILMKRETTQGVAFGPFPSLRGGEQIEVTFSAVAPTPGRVTCSVEHGGLELPGLSDSFTVGETPRHLRWVFRVQASVEDVSLILSAPEEVSIQQPTATRQTDVVADGSGSGTMGQRHQGGITFDIIHEE